MFYNVYAMHRNEATFGPDPEEFVPERWENLRPGWGYLPFNGGARSCVGRKFSRHDSAGSCTMLILISCRAIRTSGDSLRRRKDGSDLQDAGVSRRGRVDGAVRSGAMLQKRHTSSCINLMDRERDMWRNYAYTFMIVVYPVIICSGGGVGNTFVLSVNLMKMNVTMHNICFFPLSS